MLRWGRWDYENGAQNKQTNKNLRCGNRKGLLGRNDQTHHRMGPKTMESIPPSKRNTGEVESPEHFLFDCPVYQAQRQKLWEKLTSDPDVAAKCQILESKSDEEKLHSMLNEEFWGVDVDEESGLVLSTWPFQACI